MPESSLTTLGETRVRVRYAETDQMGVVYHANYFVWFEVGRVELMRQLGLDYKSLEKEENCGIAVVEATCRYQVVRVADSMLLAEGATVHVTVGKDMKKRNLPEKYAARFRQFGVETLATTPA